MRLSECIAYLLTWVCIHMCVCVYYSSYVCVCKCSCVYVCIRAYV